MTELNVGRLADDLQSLVSDAEELLRATAGVAGDKASAARDRARNPCAQCAGRLKSVERDLSGRAASSASTWRQPWKAIAVVGGVALVVGSSWDQMTEEPAGDRGPEHRPNQVTPATPVCSAVCSIRDRGGPDSTGSRGVEAEIFFAANGPDAAVGSRSPGLRFARACLRVVAVVAALWDTHRMVGVLSGAALFIILAAVFG